MNELSIDEVMQKKHILLAKIAAMSLENPEFRERITSNPKLVLQLVAEELGGSLPDDVNVVIHEETPETLHIVIPAKASSKELTNDELDSVSGGFATVLFGATLFGLFKGAQAASGAVAKNSSAQEREEAKRIAGSILNEPIISISSIPVCKKL